MTRMFNDEEPSTVPRARSELPWNVATIMIISSGRE